MKNKKITALYVLVVLVLCAFKLQEKPNFNIVFIGDSITEARGLKDQTKSPSAAASTYLAKQTHYGTIQFRNQGRSGFTTVDFLPATKKAYQNVVNAANSFKNDKPATLIFSIMLGTNDSAVKGPNGSPVSKENYKANLKTISDSLFARFPACKIVYHHPLWYSDSTRNGSTYFVEGRQRLQSYIPEISSLVKEYKSSHPGQVFLGDKKGYDYFRKNHLSDMRAETGPSGVFYLHPNEKGAEALGNLWGQALDKILRH